MYCVTDYVSPKSICLIDIGEILEKCAYFWNGWIVMLTMTVVAGLYPAWKAGKVQPVEAIKLV